MRRIYSKKLFALHETTQRRGCRFLLLALGIGPFVVFVFLSWVVATPWYREAQRQQWETQISDSLGIHVRAESLCWTAPQQFHATSVQLLHPETGVMMARMARVDGLMNAKGWSLIVDTPVIDGEQIDQGLQVVHDWFLCRPEKSSRLLALAVPGGITIHHGVESTRMERIELLLRPSSNVSMIQAKLQLEGQPFGEVVLQVTRDHAPEVTSTKVELLSSNTWIPCAAMSDRFPKLTLLGKQARFRGVVRSEITPDQWDASVSGEIHQVDWNAVTAPLGSPIRSQGILVLDQVNVRDGRILRAHGEVRCEGGTASRSWLQRWAHQLAMPSQWTQDENDSMALQSIACRFQLDSLGLTLKGQLPGPANWPPVAVKLQGGTLCTEPSPKSLQALMASMQSIPQGDDASPTLMDGSTAAISAMLPWPSSIQLDGSSSPAESAIRSRITKSLSERAIR
jgi:hypothetical protein